MFTPHAGRVYLTFNTVQLISRRGSFEGRGKQCIQLVKVLYCKLPTIGKQLPTFPHNVWGLNPRPRKWEENVLSLCHHGRCFNWICLYFCAHTSKAIHDLPTNIDIYWNIFPFNINIHTTQMIYPLVAEVPKSIKFIQWIYKRWHLHRNSKNSMSYCLPTFI